jgi:hypothetical protein
MKRAILAAIAICILSLGGAISLYQTLFCLWMCSHPIYQSSEWQTRFYIRLSTTAVIGLLLLLLFRWLLKQRRR